MPDAAEWIARELRKARNENIGEEVLNELDKTLAYTQMYIDDPTMRALPRWPL